MNRICPLCGEDVEEDETTSWNNQYAHLGCIHDIMCPHEELERL